jgi:YbbR domain-containing protein
MKNFFQRYVLHNLGLKLVAVVLATGCWLAVTRGNEQVAEVAVEVPIEFQNVNPQLEIGSEAIPRAQVRLRGPQRMIRELSAKDVYANIDLSDAGPGERTFTLTSQNIHYPHGLKVMQVIPSQFRITFDTSLTRRVEIHPQVTGTFASDRRLGTIRAVPPTIAITGPAKRVAAVDAALTDPVDATGTTQQATFVTHAYVSDPLVQVVDPGPVHVIVTMQQNSSAPTGSTRQKPE